MAIKLEHVANRFIALADALESSWPENAESLSRVEDQPDFLRSLTHLNEAAHELRRAMTRLNEWLENLK